MDKVKWGIIGCGNVCEHKSGPPMYKLEHSDLVAVMRNNPDKLADFARRHQVARTYTDASQLINDPEVNIVYIATPPGSHKKYAIEALSAGKPVYVEKPMAMNYSECMEMVEAAEKNNQKLFVAYYRRALPYFLKIKQLLDDNIIGKVIAVDIKYIRPEGDADRKPEHQSWHLNRTIGGEGYFYDLAPHTLDILDFLVGEITDAKGYGTNRAGFYEVADTVTAIMQFKSGILGSGIWSFAASGQPQQDDVVITGNRGSIKFNIFKFDPIELYAEDKVQHFTIKPPEHIQQCLIGSIIAELREEGMCPSNGISAARTAKVMDMILPVPRI
ncbi:MAG: Gfo/Idh/MocA family oxidoreductase [Tannerella sp.]|nr:Gfo/Idh/MocA family oxidoreductase [Tannerella sp.]